MDSILVLVDLTPTSYISTDQAIDIAKYKDAKLTLCYIAQSNEEANSEELKNKLDVYTSKLEEKGVKYNVHIGIGDYKNEVSTYVKNNRMDIVVVATHGKQGLKQRWFGSNIYDLIKSLPTATLVMNNATSVKNDGFTKILLPVAAHDNYLMKVEKSCEVLAPNGTMIIFNIVKSGVSVDDNISNNILATKELLTKKGVQFEFKTIESMKFSVGYSKETLEYASQNDIDLISIMTQTSESSEGVSSDVDKENILLNEVGIPVLCAN